MHNLRRWLKGGAPLVVGLPLALAASIVLAVNPHSTTLPNGADLSVEILDPPDNTELKVPAAGGPGATINVPIDATASVGQGVPNIHTTFVMDVSGSTDFFECADGVILDCEQDAVANVINDPNFASVLDVGITVFADSGASADMSPDPGDQTLTSIFADAITVANSTFSDQSGGNGGVSQFTNKTVGQFTDYTDGLTAANNSVGASPAGTKRVFFLSDGLDNSGAALAAFDAAVAALGVRIDSFALGDPAVVTCGDPNGISLQRMADLSGGNCEELDDPADIVTTLPNLIATSLDDVQIAVNSSDVPTNCVPGLPADGPVAAACDADDDLGVGDHDVEATAEGSDSAGAASVTADVEIHLLQLTASPEFASNELSEDDEHTVFGQILGGTGPDRDIDFAVISGPHTSTGGSEPATPGGAAVSFTYNAVGNACTSLGTDTIRVSTTIAGMEDFVDLAKDWVDTIPPVAQCVETVNPHGQTVPPAGSTTLPGAKGGQNEDAFWELLEEDNLTGEGCAPVQIFVEDSGSGTVFGPFFNGDKIKYTEDPDATPESKKIGSTSGQAGAIAAHIIGNGDPVVTAVDQSGNVSDPVTCLVPPPPK